MGWLLDAHGRASTGSWLGLGVLLAGVLSGAVTAPAMLIAAWFENLSAGAATVVALLRSPGGRLTLSPNVEVSGIPVRTDPDGTRSIPAGCAAGLLALAAAVRARARLNARTEHGLPVAADGGYPPTCALPRGRASSRPTPLRSEHRAARVEGRRPPRPTGRWRTPATAERA